MRTILRWFKRLTIAFLGLIALLVIATWVFMAVSPQLGQDPQSEDIARLQESPRYIDGHFKNEIPTSMDMGLSESWESLVEFFTAEHTFPPKPIPSSFEDLNQPVDSGTHITWFGHSAVLVELDGKRIMIDPMLGKAAAPVPFMATRYTYESTIPLDDLGYFDAVIISHDHYDHLDYETIEKIKENVGHFVTPLGVGSHLRSWGISSGRITELDWWDTTAVEGVRFIAAPSRHFSGRGFEQNLTLWSSWVIQGEKDKIYFSGDGGYGPHFKEIGEKLGPFDFAMIECGQYNYKWKQIHMFPEESVQASIDVKTKAMMPIH